MSSDQPVLVNQTNLLVCSPVLVKTSNSSSPLVSVARIFSLSPVFVLRIHTQNAKKNCAEMSDYQPDRFRLVDRRTERVVFVDGEEQRIVCALCPERGGIRIPLTIEVEVLPCRRLTRNGISCSLCRRRGGVDEPLDWLMEALDSESVGPTVPPSVPVAVPSVPALLAPLPGKISDGFSSVHSPTFLFGVFVLTISVTASPATVPALTSSATGSSSALSSMAACFAAVSSSATPSAGRRPFRPPQSRYGDLSAAGYRPSPSSTVLQRVRQLEGARAAEGRAPEDAAEANGSIPAVVSRPSEGAAEGAAVGDLIRRFETSV